MIEQNKDGKKCGCVVLEGCSTRCIFFIIMLFLFCFFLFLYTRLTMNVKQSSINKKDKLTECFFFFI